MSGQERVLEEVQAAWERFSTLMLRLTWRELQREEDWPLGEDDVEECRTSSA